MAKKKIPQTIEECNAELERTQKLLQQYENRNKMLNRKLSVEKRKERNHRIFLFGGFMESIVPELKTMTEDEGKDFLYHIAKSMEAQEYLKKTRRGGRSRIIPLATRARRGGRSRIIPLGTKGALIHPYGRVRSAEGLSPHRELSPRSDMAALPQQGAAPLAPLRDYPCTPAKTVHPPLASVLFLRVLLSYPGGDTHSHLPLEHRHCEPRKRQISRCRSRLPKRRKADKRMGRNDP